MAAALRDSIRLSSSMAETTYWGNSGKLLVICEMPAEAQVHDVLVVQASTDLAIRNC